MILNRFTLNIKRLNYRVSQDFSRILDRGRGNYSSPSFWSIRLRRICLKKSWLYMMSKPLFHHPKASIRPSSIIWDGRRSDGERAMRQPLPSSNPRREARSNCTSIETDSAIVAGRRCLVTARIGGTKRRRMLSPDSRNRKRFSMVAAL